MLGETIDRQILQAELDETTGGLRVVHSDGRSARLHPLWLRERSREPDVFDGHNNQRLFEASELPDGLAVTACEVTPEAGLALAFNDGHRCVIELLRLARELGWASDPQMPPPVRLWSSSLTERPEAGWSALDQPEVLKELLAGFFRYGFCILNATPTEPGTLATIARRFGFLRETNFGALFDVVTKPRPSDLAYTGRGLAAHTDNPYRHPVPGIQLLHCLENQVAGGLSTLVDGFALAEEINRVAPDEAEVLERTQVRFRYETDISILESWGSLIERDSSGNLCQVRLSSRLDYVPPLPPEDLEVFYRGRRRFHELADDRRFEIRFRLEPGMLLMMDNHRVLHGRSAFNHTQGHRHLQGCYIDHDGPQSLYRTLIRDGSAMAVGREVA